MLIIGHACSTQLGLILTTGLLISSPLAASWDKSLAGVSAWYIWYFPLDFKRAFEYDFHSFLWRECCFPCTFCLSDHVHAIVLINQRLFFFFKVLLILRCKHFQWVLYSPRSSLLLDFHTDSTSSLFAPEILERCCDCCASICLSVSCREWVGGYSFSNTNKEAHK